MHSGHSRISLALDIHYPSRRKGSTRRAALIAERGRRLERHLAEARRPPGKTLDTFDFEAVPVVGKAQVMALAAGDAWLNQEMVFVELGNGSFGSLNSSAPGTSGDLS